VRRISGSSLVAAAAVAAAALFVAVASAAGPEVLVAGDAHGLAQVRAGEEGQAGGHANPHKGGGSNLIYHNGPIMTTVSDAQAIFWGSAWSSYSGDKITGLDSFYQGIGGSNYIGTNHEYNGLNGTVGTSLTYHGHTIDASPAGSRDPGVAGVLAEVNKIVKSPSANGYYAVYTDIPRGSAGYCA